MKIVAFAQVPLAVALHTRPAPQAEVAQQYSEHVLDATDGFSLLATEEQMQAAFTDDGWLKTGDKGALDAEGNLKITGRVKDLFKTSKGKYVAPAPIEDKLVMHPAVEACVVAGVDLGATLVGRLVTNP